MTAHDQTQMNEAPISSPPQIYMDLISPLIYKAREILDMGERLLPFAFVGNLTTKQVVPIAIKPGTDEEKDKSAKEIQSVALLLGADFVFSIMEAWSLQPNKISQMDKIIDKYGNIGDSPYAIDICALALETKHGIWVSQPRIKPKGISKKKRVIGTIEFRYYMEARGRFLHLLPQKDGNGTPVTLH